MQKYSKMIKMENRQKLGYVNQIPAWENLSAFLDIEQFFDNILPNRNRKDIKHSET